MLYNMTDMIWLGRLGAVDVAAVGTAGILIWTGISLQISTKIGGKVSIAQSVGENDENQTKEMANSSLFLSILIAFSYGLFLFFFGSDLIAIFNFQNSLTMEKAISYLSIIALGAVFYFPNHTFAGIFNGYGNSSTPFYISTLGLVLNIMLDPILIFGLACFPKLESNGAAIATVISNFIVFSLFVYHLKKKTILDFSKIIKVKWANCRKILKIGLPLAMHNTLFSIIAIVVVSIIAKYGDVAVAVANICAQIEAVSWLTAEGFSIALGSFIGQNFGAKKFDRIKRSFGITLGLSSIFGLSAMFVFYVFAEEVFRFFLPDPSAFEIGVSYLKIIAISQVFMCIELTSIGGFNGIGKTVIPSIVGFVCNFLRIPGSILIPSLTGLGLSAIWWTISLTSVLKGTIVLILFIFVLKKIDSNK